MVFDGSSFTRYGAHENCRPAMGMSQDHGDRLKCMAGLDDKRQF